MIFLDFTDGIQHSSIILQNYSAMQSPEKSPAANVHNRKYILIRQQLSPFYDSRQWEEISEQNPDHYFRIQTIIQSNLLKNYELFAKYFKNYYHNHVKLRNWCLLAVQIRSQIQKYLHKQLLKRPLDWYEYQVRKSMPHKKRNKLNDSKIQNQNSLKNFSPDRVYSVEKHQQDLKHMFSFLITRPQRASLMRTDQSGQLKKLMIKTRPTARDVPESQHYQASTYNKPSRSPVSQKDEQKKSSTPLQKILKRLKRSPSKIGNFHDLYIDTFHACNGPKYISYDFDRHMKGYNSRQKYNEYIRPQSRLKQDKRLTQPSEQSTLFDKFRSMSITNLELTKSTFQITPVNNKQNCESKAKLSRVIFRKTGPKNGGKFIRV